jgi:hypothetical protein
MWLRHRPRLTNLSQEDEEDWKRNEKGERGFHLGAVALAAAASSSATALLCYAMQRRGKQTEALFSSQLLLLNSTMQKEDSTSHRNVGKCMEY